MKLNDAEIVVAIENAVCDQLEASGITADPFRLDGEKIVQVILDQLGDYVLVPKEPNREFKDRLRSYLDNLWMGDHGCDWDYFVDATAIKPNEIWRFMIEAQEPAND